jgi:hypothetical protein
MKNLMTLLALSATLGLNAQVGIGTSSPNAAAALDVVSTSKGLVPPRMTALQRNAISNPPQGLMLYCTDCGTDGQLQVYNGSEYTNVIGGSRLLTAGTDYYQIGGDIDGEAANDYSGETTALSADGTILAIGAPRNDGSAADAGHVRVYKYASNSWTKLGDDINGEITGDRSGEAISLSSDGTILAIGASYNDGNGTSAGHVRVYQYASDSWTQLGADIDGEAASDESGSSVSLSADGTILAIAARYNDGGNNSNVNVGHVRVYEYNSGSTPAWVQLGADIDGEAAGDVSGESVSLSSDGTVLAIGAAQNDGGGVERGHVRVYEYNSSSTPAWVQLGADIDGEEDYDHSGWSTSLSADGTKLAIGAKDNDDNGLSAGHVRVYQYDSGSTPPAWEQLGSDIDGEAADDYSAWSISLSLDGTTLAIGAFGTAGTSTGAGHVRVYQYNSGSTPPAWEQFGTDIDGETAADASGYSVSLSLDGTIIAVGANGNDGTGSDAGHVRVRAVNL